jgi:hypothetical protein
MVLCAIRWPMLRSAMTSKLTRLREQIGAAQVTCHELVLAGERAGLRARIGHAFEVRPSDLVTLARNGGIHLVGAPRGSIPCGRLEVRSRLPVGVA